MRAATPRGATRLCLWTIAFCAVAGFSSNPTLALEYDFTAEVTEVYPGNDPTWESVFSVGQTISGTFSYDETLTGTQANPTGSKWRFTHPSPSGSFGIRVDLPATTIEVDPSAPQVIVHDGAFGFLDVISWGTWTSILSGSVIMDWILIEAVPTPADALPAPFHIWTPLSDHQIVIRGDQFFENGCGGIGTCLTFFELTSFTEHIEPVQLPALGTAALAGLVAALLATSMPVLAARRAVSK